MVSALESSALARRIPLGEALRIALFGLDERMGADRAYQIGLVSEVLPDRTALWARAQVLAERLAQKPPIALQGTVKAVWDSQEILAGGDKAAQLHYVHVGNPLSKVEMNEITRPEWELR